MNEELLPDCGACVTGNGRHQYNTKQHGHEPQSHVAVEKPQTKEEWTAKFMTLKDRFKDRWVKVNPYSKGEPDTSDMPLFNFKKDKNERLPGNENI